MILYNVAYFGLYGNTAVCPTCHGDILDGTNCAVVPTPEGMMVHCEYCGSVLDDMERELAR